MLFKDDFPFASQSAYRRIPVRRGLTTAAQTRPLGRTSDPAERQAPQGDFQSAEVSPVTERAADPDHQDKTDWRAQALRLQAEMENFRKRQERRAEESIAAERQRLLGLTLSVADNLSRALNQNVGENEGLRQGVELTYRELMRLLESEGVTKLESVGQTFDPNLHEALATVPGKNSGSNIIIEEVEAGYKINDRLLRPAKVIVAV